MIHSTRSLIFGLASLVGVATTLSGCWVGVRARESPRQERREEHREERHEEHHEEHHGEHHHE